MQAKDTDRGSFIKIKNEIYRIKRKEVVAVGTHSHTKLKFFCKPLFGTSEKEFIFAHNDSVEMVDISKKRGQVISFQDGKIQVMDNDTFEIHDAVKSDDLTDEIAEGGPASFMILDGKVFIVNAK
jgi:translation elongation factor P/translation initiation factor 5A